MGQCTGCGNTNEYQDGAFLCFQCKGTTTIEPKLELSDYQKEVVAAHDSKPEASNWSLPGKQCAVGSLLMLDEGDFTSIQWVVMNNWAAVKDAGADIDSSSELDDLEWDTYHENRFEIDSQEWVIYDDDEADEQAAAYITEMLWSFNASFLSGDTGLDESVFEAIHNNGKCEDNNDAMLALIEGTCGIKKFIADAIDADGRGHFIANYDGEEHKLTIDGEDYYLYRQTSTYIRKVKK